MTLRSSSPAGAFSSSPAGPWTPSLTLAVSPGAIVTFYYRDTRAGVATLTATAPGTTQATRQVTVVAGVVARIALTPTSAQVRARGTRGFVAATTDAFGNVTPAPVRWRVTPTAFGSISVGEGGRAIFTAGRRLGSGAVIATSGALTATAAVTVTPAVLRIAAIDLRAGSRSLRVVVTAIDGARRPVSATTVGIVVRRDGARHFRGRARTGSGGKVGYRVPLASGCFTVSIVRATAPGFRWNGRAPRARLCT